MEVNISAEMRAFLLRSAQRERDRLKRQKEKLSLKVPWSADTLKIVQEEIDDAAYYIDCIKSWK